MSENISYTCPNCEVDNIADAKYCNNCGQKKRPAKVKISEFISEFFDSVFNIDNRFFSTLKHIFIPAYLTKRFFEGKRVSFYHPLRLYLVSILLLFAVMSILKITDLMTVDAPNIGKNYEKRMLINEQVDLMNKTIDTFMVKNETERNLDLIDSLKKELHFITDEKKVFLDRPLSNDTTNIKLLTNEYRLTGEQMFYEDIDSVIVSQNIDNWYDKLILKQMMKGARDLQSLNKFIFANMSWLLLSIIPVFSLVLKLFYIRRKRYYLEHFVFLLHVFSALLFAGTFLIILREVEVLSVTAGVLGILMFSIFPLMAFKQYYQQSYVKTFIKYLGIGFFFMISFVICFLIFALVTAALF